MAARFANRVRCRCSMGFFNCVGYWIVNKAERKAYRLQLIAQAVEKVRRERELAEQMSEEFSLEDAELLDGE